MTLRDHQSQFTIHVAQLIKFIWDEGHRCSLGEAYRTPEQAAIYAAQGKGIKDSLHCKRLAIDINLFSNEGIYLTDSKDYEFAGKYWEELDPHNRWGGTFTDSVGRAKPDGNHFERRQ